MRLKPKTDPVNVTEGDVDNYVRERFFPEGHTALMIEVGAASPDFLSLGNSFRKRGWRVISVEPNPVFAQKHREKGHEIYEFACGEDDRDDVSFILAEARNLEFRYQGGEITYEAFSSLGIRDDFRRLFSSMEDRFTVREIKVKARRLDTILDGIAGLPPVDVVAIDTEGWELECLKGFSLDRFAPKVLIIEDLFAKTVIDSYLAGQGYVRWQRLSPNNVYVRHGAEQNARRSRGFLPPMISYTPNLEDVLLRRCFPKVTDGFYVDIGAHHPTNASVTRWFYEQGWSGINVEPGEGIAALRADRKRDINLELAVSDRIGETTFWVHSGNTGTSTLQSSVPEIVSERAGEIKPVKVRLSTLPAILDEHAAGKHIQFLKIDAEGAEDAIIAAADWTRHRPEVVVAESTEPYTNQRIRAAWQEVLAKNRYRLAYFDGVNDFWVREESAHLLEEFRVPVNVLDFFKMHDPEVHSLRGQVAALTTALEATKLREPVAAEVPTTILFCTIVPLDTTSGGTIVCREHLQRIARIPCSKVHVFAPSSQEKPPTGEFVQSVGATFHPLDLHLTKENPAGLVSQGDRLFGSWATSKFPFMLEKLAVHNWRADLQFREIFDQVRPDVIVLDYLYTALFLPSAFHCGVPVSVVTLNRERDFHHQQRELGRLPADASNSVLAEWRLRRFEDEVYANADSVVVLSTNDIPADPAIAARTTVIEPVLEAYPQKWSWTGGRSLFFVGHLDHYPNFAAVRWLCESLAPALEKADPGVKITVIGADAGEVPVSWNRPNVDLLGRSTQEEVLRRFSSCGLFIAPIENNFGSKIKILECLAHATPLVSTPQALSGLPSTEGIPLFSLGDPEGAAALVTKLLQSRQELEDLSATLQSLLRVHLTKSEAAWPALIERLASQRARRRGFFLSSFLQPRRPPAPRPGGGFPRVKNPALEVGVNSLCWLRSTGLYPVEKYAGRPIRWTSAQAEFTVAVDTKKPPCWMAIQFWEIMPKEGTEFRVLANGAELVRAKLVSKTLRQIVRLPRLEGLEELTIRIETPGFQVAGDDRILGVAVESIRLSRSRWSLLRSLVQHRLVDEAAQ